MNISKNTDTKSATTTFDEGRGDIGFEKGGTLDEDKKEIYQKWKQLINMSASELGKFYLSKDGKDAGLKPKEAKNLGIHYGRESARWIVKMKKTPVAEWTPKMWEWASRQISFVSRMLGNAGALYDEKGNRTRKLKSLLIWGHNPEKFEDGGGIILYRGYSGSVDNGRYYTPNKSHATSFGENLKSLTISGSDKIFDINNESNFNALLDKVGGVIVFDGDDSLFKSFDDFYNHDNHHLGIMAEANNSWIVERYEKEISEMGYDVAKFQDGGEESYLFLKEKFESGGAVDSDTNVSKTPAPKSDRVHGSKTNAPKSAESANSAKEIRLSDSVVLSIENKLKEHNHKNADKKISLAVGKAVVRRGMGAYSATHRPTIGGGSPNSRVAWGLARLNAFIYKAVHGKSKSGKYHQDDDLLDDLKIKHKSYDDGGSITSQENFAPNGEPSNLTNEQWHLVRSPEFISWFGDWINRPKLASKVLDENGEPLVVYHGTTHEWTKYSMIKGNPDNDLGRGFYATSSLRDASTNYHANGADITGRIANLADHIKSKRDIDYEKAEEIATRKIKGNTERTISVFLKMRKPFIISESWAGGTNFDFNDIESGEEGYEEYLPSPSLVKFEEAFHKKASEFNLYQSDEILEEIKGRIFEDAEIRGKRFIQIMKENYGLLENIESIDGSTRQYDFIKEVILAMGFDGFIYDDPKLHFRGLDISHGTKHYIVFDGYKIKLADGSNTTFGSKSNDIRFDDGGELDEPKVFWGNSAGGVLLISRKTKRVLLLHRSEFVFEPNTWGIISGKIDEGENVEAAVIRELIEETGLAYEQAMQIKLKPSYVYRSSEFVFSNFIGIIDNEFVPQLNWENSDYMWCDIGECPDPLHFGVQLLLKNENLKKIKLADGSNTTFSSKSNDIRFDDGGEMYSGRTSAIKPRIGNAQIAEKHGISIEDVKRQIKIGVGVESEHTNDASVAETIASHHVFEMKDYYTRLLKMEEGEEDKSGFLFYHPQAIIHKKDDPNNIGYFNGLFKSLGINITLKKYLSSGFSGMAFLTESGTICKTTASAQEAFVSLKMKSEQDSLQAQVKILGVYKIVSESNQLFIIEKERAVVLDKYLKESMGISFYADPYRYLLYQISTAVKANLTNEEIFEQLHELEEYAQATTSEKHKKKIDKFFEDYADFCRRLNVDRKTLNEELTDDTDENIGYVGGKIYCFDCGNQSQGRLEEGGELEAKGDCMKVAYDVLVGNIDVGMNFIGKPYVVHAEAKGQGKIKGLRFTHAWVEDDVLVYDFSNGNKGIVPKALYYKVGDIKTTNPKKYIRYSASELMQKVSEHGTYGAFGLLDCKYEEGGTVEDPNRAIMDYFNSLPFTRISYISPKEMKFHSTSRDASYKFEEDNGLGEFDATYLTDSALAALASMYGFNGSN